YGTMVLNKTTTPRIIAGNNEVPDITTMIIKIFIKISLTNKPIQRLVPNQSIDSDLHERIHSLPSPHHLRVTAYILMIVLILS
ncbi:unnamed protein product, partial [Rotaria sp. Silwood1]